MTKLVNLYKEKCDVIITRNKKGKIPEPPEFGCFGNPFTVQKYGLQKCLELFKLYFYERVEKDKNFRDAVLNLKNKTLGCVCCPKPCHGDIIIEWLKQNEK